MRKALPLLVLLSLTGCAAFRNTLTIPPARCASLIPSGWSKGIDGAPIPDDTGVTLDSERVKLWQKAFVAQSGQLSKSNGRTGDVISIVTNCETMVNAARPD